MKPRHLVSPLQRAWLDELGVDTHWLAVAKPTAASPEKAARVLQTPAAVPVAERAPARPSREEGGRRAPNEPMSPPPVPSSTPSVVEGAQALAQAVQTCLQPVAGGPRGLAVPGVGQWDRPRYFIVGEQPGIEDEAVGRPFQGSPGKLLRAMLGSVFLPQVDQAYLTNLVKCRLPGGRAPSPEEVAACLPYLQQEIAQVRPRWILALGGVAAQAVLQSTEGLDALRGQHQVWHGPDGSDIPVWVTHHPASLLVRSADKLQAWRDLVALSQAVVAAG
ncbi:MAG TPA: uracil-DNA glycosylase [Castellaniella sp.]|uniref:uracil-DNA glycosylase n=1 Tax=Castellaniella sp. TaxID=1955812 RepID=UPI002EF7D124